ncbi:MAG: bifunctional adenosylcobinamide kinase/adenosylcobinamide-phosphate guanylyltransferase [Eubacteriales bacterium]
MIFITGGMAQGKTAFAESFCYPILDDLEMNIQNWITQGLDTESDILLQIEQEVRQICNTATTETMWKQNVVVVSREIGCGIIPIEKTEVRWRELAGRIACMIASHAEEVYKMESGIAVKIK